MRISQRNCRVSYIDNSAEDGFTDYLILGLHNRNRALNNDMVVIKPKPRDLWVIKGSVFKAWEEENIILENVNSSKENESLEPKCFENNIIDEQMIDNKFIDNSELEDLIVDDSLLAVSFL